MKQTIEIEIEVPDGYKAVYKEDTQKIEIIEVILPKSWEEFCENYPVQYEEHFIDNLSYTTMCKKEGKRFLDKDKNLLPNKETAEAFLALIQLIQLRDCYRQGWKPNWSDNNNKYTIDYYENKICYNLYQNTSKILSFKSEDTRNIFCKNFRDLIEKAKELI